MLKKFGVSTVIFCAVAATLALLLVVVFLVAAIRKKHVRRALDVLAIVFCVLTLVVSLLAGCFAVVFKYRPWGLSVVGEADKLIFLLRDKQWLAVPYLGKTVFLFGRLRLIGVIAPATVFVLSILSMVTVAARARRKPKQPKAAKTVKEPIVSVADELADGSVAENALPEERDFPQDNDVSVLRESQEERTEPEELPTEHAKNILEEIDRLVTDSQPFAGEEPSVGAEDIARKLRRAIEEGNALYDTLTHPQSYADVSEERSAHATAGKKEESAPAVDLPDQPKSSRQEPTEETRAQTEPKQATVPPQEEDISAVPQRAESFVRFRHKEREIEVTDYEHHEPERPAPSFDAHTRTAVRTIVRRPTAKNIDDITRRAEEILEETNEEKEATVHKAKSDAASGKKATVKARASSKTHADNAPKVDKAVEAEQSGLPLTRKYIILNRRNAAAVFNDYLNSKRAREKEELTGSLNTIIMK